MTAEVAPTNKSWYDAYLSSQKQRLYELRISEKIKAAAQFSSTTYSNPKIKFDSDKLLQKAIYPHISSFNTFLDHFLKEIVHELTPVYVDPSYSIEECELNPFYEPQNYLKIFVRKIEIGYPIHPEREEHKLYPSQCRNGHWTYAAPLYVEYGCENKQYQKNITIRKNCGTIPIMVGSNKCHLNNLSESELINLHEEANEAGGYFILNGNERVIRFVIQQRSNYPIALVKGRFVTRDIMFTEFAVSMRCARKDGTSTTNIMYFTEDRQCAVRVLINRREVFIPFWTLLRALLPSIHVDLIKQKLFEEELANIRQTNNQNTSYDEKSKNLHRFLQFNMLWEDFMSQDSVISDLEYTGNRYLHLLGKTVWDLFQSRLRPNAKYEDAGKLLIKQYILVHATNWTAKFESLILMYRKLIALANHEIQPENLDSLAFQEVITPGQVIAGVLKDALQVSLQKIRASYLAEIRIAKSISEDPNKVIWSQKQLETILQGITAEISHVLYYFIATGNMRISQLDIQQTVGWTVVADRLNANRFLSFFRAVHRGQFFTQMRTTEVRKLLSETWGFLCPVHTPDGEPCGLLLHLAQNARPVTDPADGSAIAAIKYYLYQRGIITDFTGHFLSPPCVMSDNFPLIVDGQPLCRLPYSDFDYWLSEFQLMKANLLYGIPQHMEVAGFKKDTKSFVGIFLFTYPGRLVRPIKSLSTNKLEWVGPLAQPWMNIACTEKEVQESNYWLKRDLKDALALSQNSVQTSSYKNIKLEINPQNNNKNEDTNNTTKKIDNMTFLNEKINALKKVEDTVKKVHKYMRKNQLLESTSFMFSPSAAPVKFTHVEINPRVILSITAALIPFSHHNQSPRNMFQCQMLKQTIATPFYSIPYRSDNKAYRLITPQHPCVQSKEYRSYNFEEYPSGTNAIVAVISYTGYDMEDAMILNKASVERGGFCSTVYKTKIIDAAPANASMTDSKRYIFYNEDTLHNPIESKLECDGLPKIGTKLTHNSPIARSITINSLHSTSNKTPANVTLYHDSEVAYVDKINYIGAPTDSSTAKNRSATMGQRVSIKLRCPRPPIVGDKFASRAGQKGILSMLCPQEDMPFTESGITPDIVFNPHGFPSRMTIGMFIESIAGKAAAIHGAVQDCTPFRTYPKQKSCGVPWIDQEGYHGWVSRGNRFRTEQEEKEKTTDNSVDYFGKALLQAGYQYYGTEPMYSGVYGNELQCHIFIGIIYYQRLRHMVSDKWQVRATGPVDALTRQPVKGRRKGGGVRFGEMEKDALISHGATCLLLDRLLHCSDKHNTFVCPSCGSILSPVIKRPTVLKKPIAICRSCNVPCRYVSLPFVFRYICNEFAAMNINIRLQLSSLGKVLKQESNEDSKDDKEHPLFILPQAS